MRPGISSRAIWKVEPWEYCVRFLFGGAVTLGTGIIAHAWGPEIGGLFLAFPAILPASLTLVKRHDGCPPVVAGSRGACLGAVGLLGFALVASALARNACPAALTLATATAAWAAIAVTLWGLCFGASEARTRRHSELTS